MNAAPRRLPLVPTLLALTALLFAAVFAGSLFGSVPLPPAEVAQDIAHRVLPFAVPAPGKDLAGEPLVVVPEEEEPPENLTSSILGLRLPRVLAALLVGASLAATGAALQGVLGNPLAEPYTIGVSSGAAVGAGLAILLGVSGAWFGLASPLCAFGAALLTMLFVFALSRVGGRLHTAGFLLTGLVVGSFLWAIMTLILTLAKTEQRTILNWLMGRLNEVTPRETWILLPFVLAGIVFFTWRGRDLDALSFGDETARSLGVQTEQIKTLTLVLATLVTAATVAVAGIIGFVGLIVPHIARALVGPSHRRLIPTAALLGAALTVLADLLSRIALPGNELPVGVVTALLGAPAFAVLLRQQMGE